MRILTPLVLLCGLAACEPGTTPDPPDGAESISAFVVGDSWAELSQGTIEVVSADHMPASRLRQLGYDVTEEYAYGFGGTAAVFWAAGIPCDTPQAACGDNGVDEALFDDLAQATDPPVVYLSLGGNDVRVGGALVDLNEEENRDEVFGNLRVGLDTVVADIVATRPDAEIVLAGYANFHFDGASELTQQACDAYFDALLPATPSPTEALVNNLFGDGELEGLHDVYRDLGDTYEQVHFTPHQLMFADDADTPTAPSNTGTMLDCLHLQPSLQRDFVDAVIDGWEAGQ